MRAPLFRRAFLKTAGLIAATGASVPALAAASDNKVVYHLSERDGCCSCSATSRTI